MEQILHAREFAVLTLSSSALHVGLNQLAIGDTSCPYDEPLSVVLMLGVFLAFVFAAWQRRPHVDLARDVLALVPGIWFQITTKPPGFYAGVPVEGCDMRSSGYAQALWLLGELLTFGATVPLARAAGFGRTWAATATVIAAAFALQALTGVAAAELRNVY